VVLQCFSDRSVSSFFADVSHFSISVHDETSIRKTDIDTTPLALPLVCRQCPAVYCLNIAKALYVVINLIFSKSAVVITGKISGSSIALLSEKSLKNHFTSVSSRTHIYVKLCGTVKRLCDLLVTLQG